METSDSIDKSWDSTSDTTTTAGRADALDGSSDAPSSGPGGWMVNVAGRDVVEMSHADVISKWRSGELLGSVLVWREGMESWAKLESIPAFQIIGKHKVLEKEEPSTTEDTNTNVVAVYERPMPTLVFDEAVESEWKRTPKAPEPQTSPRPASVTARHGSASARPASNAARPASSSSRPASGAARPASVSARPPAPSVPPLAQRVARPSPAVPPDEPPPPPPLPSRAPPAPVRSARPPMPTIPGGLTAPAPSASVAPPTSSSRSPAATPSSPLLAAIASASMPAPVPAAAPEPESIPTASPALAAMRLDEASVIARLGAMRSVSLRNAVIACVGSALVASLVTGLVVGSRTRQAAPAIERPPERPVAAAPAPVVPATPPPAAAAPAPAPEPSATAAPQAPTAAAAPAVAKVAVAELPASDKPKVAKPSKVVSWKPPRENAAETLEGVEKPAPNPERDDPERAVPDRVDERSTTPPVTDDPGF